MFVQMLITTLEVATGICLLISLIHLLRRALGDAKPFFKGSLICDVALVILLFT